MPAARLLLLRSLGAVLKLSASPWTGNLPLMSCMTSTSTLPMGHLPSLETTSHVRRNFL